MSHQFNPLRSRMIGLLLICSSAFLLAFGPPRLTESDEAQMPIFASQLRALSQEQLPNVNAKAALIMDMPTGRVVYDRNMHEHVAPASTTKIMTAILALEKGRLTDKVTVEAKNLVGESTMGLVPGDVVTLEDLLWGLLLPSGNDAANVIAAYLGGTVDNFVKMMNDKAAELGLRDTHFMNPHGLDQEGHYSSAYDLAIMGRYGMKNAVFAKIVATNMYTVNASRTFYMLNSNQLLRMKETVPGVDGIKTGTTGDAGDCIVASVNRDGHRIIAVVMGAPSRAPEAIKLIDYAYRNFTWVPLEPPPVFTTLDPDKKQQQLALSAEREEMMPLWQSQYVFPFVSIDHDTAEWEPGSQVGSVDFRLGGVPLIRLPVFVR